MRRAGRRPALERRIERIELDLLQVARAAGRAREAEVGVVRAAEVARRTAPASAAVVRPVLPSKVYVSVLGRGSLQDTFTLCQLPSVKLLRATWLLNR